MVINKNLTLYGTMDFSHVTSLFNIIKKSQEIYSGC